MPFKKGQSGNPKKQFSKENQPENRRKPMPDFKDLLANVAAEEKNGQTELERVIRSMFNEAKAGNVTAQKLVIERIAGTVAQEINSNVTLNTIEVGYGKPDAENNV